VCSSGRSADWSFHLGRSSYTRGVLQISAEGIAPTFWGCSFEFWINEVICISNMTELLLILHMKLEIPELSFPWAMDGKPTRLLCVRMDERTGLQCEGGNVICIAWSHFGCGRLHQKQSAEAATSNPHSSQPSRSLCCGWRWHFWKPALSTNQFKLKVISHS